MDPPTSAIRVGRFNSYSNNAPNSPSASIATSSKKVQLPMEPSTQVFNYIAEKDESREPRNKNTLRLFIKGFGKSGTILTRCTASSIFITKKWTKSYWLHVYPATIKIFDSKEKMEEWKKVYDPENPNSTNNSAKKLFIKSINFDTQGKLQRKIARHQEKAKGVKTTQDPNAFNEYQYGGPLCYAMEDVQSKFYRTQKNEVLHTCKLSYCSNTGRTIAIAFGSADSNELKNIRSIMRYCIRLVRKVSKKRPAVSSSKSTSSPRITDDVSVMSGMTHGAMSVVSATEYGQGTMKERDLKIMKKRDAKMVFAS